MKLKFWFIVHNLIAHPLLIFNNAKSSWAGRFHDWTASKMRGPIAIERPINAGIEGTITSYEMRDGKRVITDMDITGVSIDRHVVPKDFLLPPYVTQSKPRWEDQDWLTTLSKGHAIWEQDLIKAMRRAGEVVEVNIHVKTQGSNFAWQKIEVEAPTASIYWELGYCQKLIVLDEYETDVFKETFASLEKRLGYSFDQLVLMRFEINKRRKQKFAKAKQKDTSLYPHHEIPQ